MRFLRLYFRVDCHLCDTMLSQLNELQNGNRFSLELIDVDQDTATRMHYNARVPVLETAEGECLSEYFLDENRLLSYLDGN